MVELHEATSVAVNGGDEYEAKSVKQIRVLRWQRSEVGGQKSECQCVVEIWQRKVLAHGQRVKKSDKAKWKLVETRTPLRLGKPLPLIPFVFHGQNHSQPAVEKLPLADIITVNLDHYRLDADYKHGVHFTALPTAWVSGFDKTSSLRIGSSTAWVTETAGADGPSINTVGVRLACKVTSAGHGPGKKLR